jgi:hypothetical protein
MSAGKFRIRKLIGLAYPENTRRIDSKRREMTSKGATLSEDAWEKQYSAVREAVLKIGSGEDVGAVDKQIKSLETSLKLMREEVVQGKRTKIADLRRSLLLRQASAQPTGLSAMSSSSSSAPGQTTSEQLLEQARSEIRRQDARLDPISSNLSELRLVGDRINDTANLHTRLIDEIDDESQSTHRLLGTMSDGGERLKRLKQASSVWRLHCAIIALLVLFLLLLMMKA